jgi:hypothetical protein
MAQSNPNIVETRNALLIDAKLLTHSEGVTASERLVSRRTVLFCVQRATKKSLSNNGNVTDVESPGWGEVAGSRTAQAHGDDPRHLRRKPRRGEVVPHTQ